jgi:peptide/nickel transport system permease protein
VTTVRKSTSYWGFVLQSLLHDKMTLAAIGVLALLALFTVVLAGPITHALSVTPDQTNPALQFQGPSREHLLGVDHLGRDQLARLLYGGRVSLGVALFSALISMTLGILVGAVAGIGGGRADDVVMWLINTLSSIPFIMLLLIVTTLFKPNAFTLTIFIGLMSWMGVSRIVRGQIIQVRQLEYVTAARAIGAPTSRLVGRHILPNVIPIVIIFAVQITADVILIESALSFLGLGVQPPTATWGNMLTKAQSYFFRGPHLVIWPGLFITITVLCLYMIGDGLRDALDPMMRGAR